VAAAQSSYANANIRTPIAGTVYYLPVSQYDYVKGGDDLVFVADLTRLRITAYFDEPEIGNLAAGQSVKIEWGAKQNMVWHGHISLAPTTIINYNGTRNVGECFITVDDADGVLQPNANVTVTVTTAEHKNVLSVPREALHFEDSQPYVLRVLRDRLVRTPVQVGIVNNNFAEISSGLAEGETVALNATTNRDLADGIEVRPISK
jgi:HlyD family secretion protein